MSEGRAAYQGWEDKGPIEDGRRVTIMTGNLRVAAGQPVHVHHVAEVVGPERRAYPMGPKLVTDEYLDDRLVTPGSDGEDPLVPKDYDGVTLRGPAVDLGWEVTAYRLDRPGRHTIQWRPGGLRSNLLEIIVGDDPEG